MPSYPRGSMQNSVSARNPPAASAGLPRIRRARGFRLYDVRGKRYLDLSRDGALLGHRGAAALSAMKSVLSQGLATALPSAWEARLAAAILRLLPESRSVRLFSSRERALEAVSRFLGRRIDIQEVHDPALDSPAPDPMLPALWRPFLPIPKAAAALLPVLPFTLCGAPAPVCFPTELAADQVPSDTLPGFMLAGALHGLNALSEEGRAGPPSGRAGSPPRAGGPTPTGHARKQPHWGSRAVERVLDAARGWKRSGPYVRAVFPAAEYARVHAEFLAAGVLLCTDYPGPSVLPGECSLGETSLLADLFARIPGG